MAKTNRKWAGTARRSLDVTMAIREAIDPHVIVEFQLAILQGKNPVLVPAPQLERGYTIRNDDGAPAPTLEEKTRALKDLTDRGWGQAVQAIALQADIRTRIEGAGAGLPTGQLPPRAIFELESALRAALGPGSPAPGTPASANDDVIDAECTEVPASASTDDDEDDELAPAPTTASTDNDATDDE